VVLSRVERHSAVPWWSPLFFCALPLVAPACTPDAPGRAPAGAPAPDRSHLLAVLTDEAPPRASAPAVIGLHAPLARRPGTELLFASRGVGVAFEVETERGAYVVHNGRPGKTYAAVGEVALSPDGAHVAHGALVDGRWRMVRDGVEGEAFDAVDAPVFSPDGAHLAYEAMSGLFWHLVVDGAASYRSPTRFLASAFSGDSSRIAFVEDFDPPLLAQLIVSDLEFQRPTVVATDVAGMVLDEGGTRVASVSAALGGNALLTVRLDAPERVALGPRYDAIRGPVFGADGAVTYLAERGGARFVVLDEAEEPLPPGDLSGGLVPRGQGRGVGVLVASGGSTRLHELFTRERGAPLPRYDAAAELTYDPSGRSHAFAASRGGRWHVVVNGHEGPPFDRVVTPRFSPDGERVVYRARQDGRRFVVTADLRGRTRRRYPGFDQVYPASFTADGSAVVYGVKDAANVVWRVEAP
jgi:hypothetical protein